jgi:hypothetical protein
MYAPAFLLSAPTFLFLSAPLFRSTSDLVGHGLSGISGSRSLSGGVDLPI